MADLILLARPNPVRGLCYEKAEESINYLTSALITQGFRVGLPHRDGAVPAIVRNRMVADGIKLKAKWVLFIDTDMVVPSNLGEKLLEHDKDIVAALAVLKVPPFEPVAYKRHIGEYKHIENLPENELVEVDAVGFGAVLIKMSVFENLKKPYFANPAWGEITMGEDIYFCKHAKEAGFSIYLDTSVQTGHVGDYVYTYQDYLIHNEKRKPKSNLILPKGMLVN